MVIRERKAQSTLEYAIIVAVVVGALLAIQVYLKRGVQGKLRSSVDNIGDQYSAGITTSKYVTTEDMSVTKERVGTDGSFAGATGKGVTRTEIVDPGAVTRQATGAGAEKVTKKLNEEDLIDEQGTLFDD